MSLEQPSKKSIEVAVGIVTDAKGRYLIALRVPKGLHSLEDDFLDFWEFPGGKVEEGESVYQALCRELQEEVGLCVGAASLLLQTSYEYAAHSVLLHVWRVESYEGEALGLEGQPIRWVSLQEMQQLRFLPANALMMEHLK